MQSTGVTIAIDYRYQTKIWGQSPITNHYWFGNSWQRSMPHMIGIWASFMARLDLFDSCCPVNETGILGRSFISEFYWSICLMQYPWIMLHLRPHLWLSWAALMYMQGAVKLNYWGEVLKFRLIGLYVSCWGSTASGLHLSLDCGAAMIGSIMEQTGILGRSIINRSNWLYISKCNATSG